MFAIFLLIYRSRNTRNLELEIDSKLNAIPAKDDTRNQAVCSQVKFQISLQCC